MIDYKHIYYNLILKSKSLKQNQINIENISNNHNKKKLRINFSRENYFLEFSFTFTTEEPPYVKSNFKFMIKTKNSLCFIIRLDLKESHTNPSFEDMPENILKELDNLKDDKLFLQIYNLLKEYEEHYFSREEGHIHIFIKGSNHCDKWAVPIEKFVDLLLNFIQSKHKEQKKLNFSNINLENDYKKTLKNYIIKFLMLINFTIDVNEIEEYIDENKLLTILN